MPWVLLFVGLLVCGVSHASTEWVVMLRGPRPANPFDLDFARVRLVRMPDDSAAARRTLMERTDIAWAEPNFRRTLAVDDALPSDPLLQDTRQWGIHNAGPGGAYAGRERADAHVIEAWQASPRPGVVRVAIADTGVDPGHPEFRGRVEAPYDATGRGQTRDRAGHGTMVTGIVAARVGDGAHFDSLGIAGVCGGDGAHLPACSILPIHITIGSSNLASSHDIARAIVHATDAGARVLNLSVAGSGRSRLERLALYYATVRGCVVVAASGNRGFLQEQTPMYPAAYSRDGLCIQVGASTPRDTRATFSSYGHGIDVIAPGENIWSTWPTYPIGAANWNGYAVGSGTSFAAPFVTGSVALILAARPELRDRAVQALLRMSAEDIGPPGDDAEHGAGRLDAGAAMRAIGADVAIWHDEVAATEFEAMHSDTLRLGEQGPGDFAAAADGRLARMYEATSVITLPDSFETDVHVWPRVGGTYTLRSGHRLAYFAPWAEVERVGPRAFRIRGYVYRAGETWIPLPPDQIRFGFTVVGRRAAPRRPPVIALRAHPNPFAGSVFIATAGGADVSIYDITGRRVAAARSRNREIHWNGCDAEGRNLPAGIYVVRASHATGTASARVVKLD